MAQEAGRVFTIGYGGRKLADLARLLKEHQVRFLVDIRLFPRSQNSDFDREKLEKSLPPCSLVYIVMAETLGGLRRGGYHKHQASPAYARDLAELMKLVRQGNLALMCKERSDAGCHRRYIVQSLRERGLNPIPLP